MIFGTAGHIDHGKTALVKALTGIDGDRLAEEKRRGITIDLGYAYSESPDGSILGFVDVPGHEKFVHNMLAGATGIDHALLVIAADDGVMPQTREHLAVLELLAVRDGAVVLTKIDRVDESQLQALQSQVEQLVADTFLAHAPQFRVSNRTGEGIDELKRYLLNAADLNKIGGGGEAAVDGVAATLHAGFRMAIDRVFTLAGIGTIATGTVHAGRISVGDVVRLAPSGLELRVRGVHAQNRIASVALAGQRCAINLSGERFERSLVARGDWLTAPWLHRATTRFDARLQALAQLAHPLTAWMPAHLHLGAADVMCRIVPLSHTQVDAGQQAWVQVVCEAELHVCAGDRFVLRNQAANQTLAGGRVVDIAAPQRKRRTEQRLAQLQVLSIGKIAERLLEWVRQSETAVTLSPLAAQWNVPESDLNTLARTHDEFVCKPMQPAGSDMRAHETWVVWHRDCWSRVCARLIAALAEFHRQFPDELGCERDRLRRIAVPTVMRSAARLVIQCLIDQGDIQASGVFLHSVQHRITLSQSEQQFRDHALQILNETGLEPPWVRDMARLTGVDEALARGYLLRLVRHADVHQVVKDLFFSQQAIDRLTIAARSLHESEGAITAARFRDVSGLSRKRAIQVLEYFDRVGIARRVRDVHYVREQHLV
jgi:selenocysteine-specific elongation factor